MKSQPARIFLVEDNADDRFLLLQAFANANFADSVRMFSGSDVFLNHVVGIPNEELPTLFVLDFNMPVINGGELLMKLKQLEKTKSIPVVLYSKGLHPILRETLIAAGALDCFEKAVQQTDLLKLAKTFRMLAEGHQVVY